MQDQLAGPGSRLFRPGMKLEAKDRQHPSIVSVATVANVKDGRLLIRFDGWSSRCVTYIICSILTQCVCKL